MRLEAQLRRAQVGAADAVLFSVLGAVQDFAAARPLVDDMSLVIVRRAPLYLLQELSRQPDVMGLREDPTFRELISNSTPTRNR